MKYILLLYITTFILHVHNVDGKTTSRSHPSSHVKRRSRVQKLRQALNITTSDILDADNKTTSNTVLKQNIAYSSPDELVGQNETQANGEKKGTFENAQKKVEVRTKSIDSKGMSAIVVIGNRTHRVSGPVVKELLAELQKQNEDEEKSKKSVENGQVGQSGASNLRRIYAANEVAEINRLLGKPLTDAKALGLIKNLLLDRVHTHLAKTMETNQIFDPSQRKWVATIPSRLALSLVRQRERNKALFTTLTVMVVLSSSDSCSSTPALTGKTRDFRTKSGAALSPPSLQVASHAGLTRILS